MTTSKKVTVLIDENCSCQGGKVLCVNDVFYACTLNQTNIKSNANKFYIIQIVTTGKKYIVFIRYGRIGEIGTKSEAVYDDVDSAIKHFTKQFKTKTGNNWNAKDKFVKKEGKYFMTEVAYDEVKNIEKVTEIADTPKIVESKLDPLVVKLIEMISDINMMKNSLVKLEIDTKKLPLGKISNSQLDKAMQLLKDIKKQLDDGKNDEDMMAELSSQYYTYIPFACGRKKPPLIDNTTMIGKYTNLLDELRNLVVAVKIIDDSQKKSDINPIDNVHASLNTNIKPLDKKCEMWEHIENYVKNTHAPTHYYRTELLEIYEIERMGERETYEAFTKGMENKMLLFHGSRMANFCSILKNGLVLNPEMLAPGVIITGKMFGYGNYSSCSLSKSFNYCDAGSSNNIGALLLCEYALGKQLCLTNADTTLNATKIAKMGYNSTWGIGGTTPGSNVVVNGVIIPNGKLTKCKKKTTLLYDEFIVYDQRQICQKYLILVKEIDIV